MAFWRFKSGRRPHRLQSVASTPSANPKISEHSEVHSAVLRRPGDLASLAPLATFRIAFWVLFGEQSPSKVRIVTRNVSGVMRRE